VSDERVRFTASEVALEGVRHLPAGAAAGPLAGVVVCHPHPLYGGDMWNDVVDQVCRELLARGMAALRFNFRGTGGSGGEHSGGQGERDDVWAALDYLRSRAEVERTRLGLVGYSFGAAVALNAGPAAGVQALAAISAPPRLIDFTALQGFEIPLLLIAGDLTLRPRGIDVERWCLGAGIRPALAAPQRFELTRMRGTCPHLSRGQPDRPKPLGVGSRFQGEGGQSVARIGHRLRNRGIGLTECLARNEH